MLIFLAEGGKEIFFASEDSHFITDSWSSSSLEFEFRTNQNRSRLLSVGSAKKSMVLELLKGSRKFRHFLKAYTFLGHIIELSSPSIAAKTLRLISPRQ